MYPLFLYTAGGIRPLTNDGTARLIRNFNNYEDDGKKVAIITLLDINSNIRRFVGMIALGRYSDDEVLKKIALLNKLGVKTIVFSCKHEHNVPAMPKELDALPSISLDIFRKKELPIVHSFGKYMLY